MACEKFFQAELVNLRSKIAFLDSVIRAKDDYLVNFERQVLHSTNISKLMNGSYLRENTETSAIVQPEVAAFLKNISGTRTAASFYRKDTPSYLPLYLNQLMPHLMEQPRSLKPAFLMSSGRQYVDVVVGVPTVKREFDNYLMITLESLVKNLSPLEANSTLIVVCIGETDPIIVMSIALEIEKTWGAELDSGLIDVIAPSPSYYPNFETILPTLGDSTKRNRWRTKQNLDVIYTMAYSHIKGRFYLMFEDDIISSHSYIKTIIIKVGELSALYPNWIVIYFSEIAERGFGNLFRSSTLVHMISYMQLFYSNLPTDWLVTSYIQDLVCTPLNKNNEQCGLMIKKASIVEKCLFKHIGSYSSLSGKMHEVEGTQGSVLKLYLPHNNPPLSEICCTITTFSDYTIESAYEGKNFFWGEEAKSDDFILFQFAAPTVVKSFKFRTGNALHVADQLHKAVVEIKLAKNDQDGRFVPITNFDEFGMAEATLSPNLGPLESLRIRILDRIDRWFVISEIDIKTPTSS